MAETKQIKYTNKSFSNIIEEFGTYAKQYFPDFFSNMTDVYSIERLIAEFVAYQADVLNFQINDTYRQLLRQYATDNEAIFRNAKSLGYKIQTSKVAVGYVRFSQLVPAISSSGTYIPDTSYCAIINSGATVSNVNGAITYTTIEECDFSEYDSTLTDVTQFNAENPSQFRIYKDIKVRSGEKVIKKLTITDAISYKTLYVDDYVAFIESVVDEEGNTWYEVDYLAQDYIFHKVQNNGTVKEYVPFAEETPFVLKMKKVSRRFIVDRKSDGRCYLMFGSGKDVINNDLLALSADDILSNNEIANLNLSSTVIADGFTKSDSYGLTPYNTTLTIGYVITRGQTENLKSNNVTNLVNVRPTFTQTVSDEILNSIRVTNPTSIVGADILTDFSKIQQESMGAFVSQNRCVTVEDYMIRVKLLPSYFGGISKSFVERNMAQPSTLDVYVLSKDNLGYAIHSNTLTKTNVMNYINEFRMIGTKLIIKDAYIINFGVYFDYNVLKGYDKNLIFLDISKRIEEYFKPERWEINQPIVIEDFKLYLYGIDGLASINNITFKCINDEGYSNAYYMMDISDNNSHYDKNKGVLYPPAYPSLFELKNPKNNIKGRYV